MTPEQLMARWGVTKFKMNPPRVSFDKMQPLMDKYGINGAAEIEEEKIGPFCDSESCRIPFGISVGKDNIAVNVFAFVKSGIVTELDVF